MSFSSLNKRTGSCRFTQLFFLLLMTATAFSQVGTGIIRGVVTDASGARLGNAEVTVTNTQTGLTEKEITDSAGVYNVPSISIGTYKVQVQNQGFKTAQVNDVVLSVGETKEVNISLVIGQISQEVSVEAQAAQVDTDTSMVAGRINQTQMRDLRSTDATSSSSSSSRPASYPSLMPHPPPTSGARRSTPSPVRVLSARKSRSSGQSIQDFWDRGSGAAVLGTSLGVDAIAEFQTYTSTASSQFGGANGGVNAVTRSGTNKIHGSEYYFARNDVFDAPPRFVPTTGKTTLQSATS